MSHRRTVECKSVSSSDWKTLRCSNLLPELDYPKSQIEVPDLRNDLPFAVDLYQREIVDKFFGQVDVLDPNMRGCWTANRHGYDLILAMIALLFRRWAVRNDIHVCVDCQLN